MPCRSDYMEPNGREIELRRTAQLLIYVRQKLNMKIKKWMEDAAGNMYCNDDRAVMKLCSTLRRLDPETLQAIVYQAHERDARDLANWWEEHQAADAKREAAEAQAKQKKEAREKALSKLSSEDREVLGL